MSAAGLRQSVAAAVRGVSCAQLRESPAVHGGPDVSAKHTKHLGFSVLMTGAVALDTLTTSLLMVRELVTVRIAFQITPSMSRVQLDQWDELIGPIEAESIAAVLAVGCPGRVAFESVERETGEQFAYLNLTFTIDRCIDLQC